MPRTVLILGAAGGARLAYWQIRETWNDVAIAFVDDKVPEFTIDNQVYEVIQDWDFARLREQAGDAAAFTEFIVGSGYPRTKQQLVQKALDHGLTPAPTVVHPKVMILGGDVSIGRGGILSPGCLVATGTRLGNFVHIAPNSVVGHDDLVGDYVSINAGCNVAGDWTIGEGVLIGSGAVIREKLHIAPWVTIGAQACLVKDVEESGLTLAGVPAKPIHKP
jgi:sugar O-acyltransferase (sialic acid O-acetyltransferase NeuD family)